MRHFAAQAAFFILANIALVFSVDAPWVATGEFGVTVEDRRRAAGSF